MIAKIKKYITKSEFLKNSLILVSGTTLAQLLPLAISPILTRLFSPDDFGVLALFTSLSLIFANLASGKYEMAIILPKKDTSAINILALCFYISFFVTFFLLISVILFHDFFVEILKTDKISVWLYVLPFVVFFLAGYNSLTFFYVRLKNYKIQAQNKVIRSFVTSILQLAFYFTKSGIFALVGGYSFGQLSGNVAMLRGVLKNKKLISQIKKAKMIALSKRYNNFPRITLPATLFNRASTEIPNIFITPFFDAATLGFYSLSYRILSLPSGFIGESISQVFMQTANDEVKSNGNCVRVFYSVLKKLTLIGLLFFTVIAIFAEPIFGFVFGKQWAVAGVYAQILSPLLFFRFLVGSLSSLLYIFEKHKIILFLQIGMFVLSIIIFIVSFYLKLTFVEFLYFFSISLSVFYIVYLIILHLVAQTKI